MSSFERAQTDCSWGSPVMGKAVQDVPSKCHAPLPTAHTSLDAMQNTSNVAFVAPNGDWQDHVNPSQWHATPDPPTTQTSSGAQPCTARRSFFPIEMS